MTVTLACCHNFGAAAMSLPCRSLRRLGLKPLPVLANRCDRGQRVIACHKYGHQIRTIGMRLDVTTALASGTRYSSKTPNGGAPS